jgi:hypothetical protein
VGGSAEEGGVITISYEGMEDLQLWLLRLKEENLKRALRNATNDTAFATMTVGRYRMKQVFDKPTPWTISSWYVRKKASYADMAASVGMTDHLTSSNEAGADGADAVLYQHFAGGQRSRKGIEMRLFAAGLMSGSERLVISKSANVDKYGNLPGATVTTIMSDLKIQADRNQWSQSSGGLGGFFWSRGDYFPRGVWQRKVNGVHPILLVVGVANYQKRMDLDELKAEMFKNYFLPIFDQELRYQLEHYQ